MKRCLALLLIFLSALTLARAESPDDQYVRIYNTIQDADALNVWRRQGDPGIDEISRSPNRLGSIPQNLSGVESESGQLST